MRPFFKRPKNFMNPVISVATRAARAAGKVINRTLNTQQDLHIEEKSVNNYVTNIDHECEEAILYQLQKAYPTHSFLTEERDLIQGQDPEYLWVIDPIDGTTNFIHNLPHFAVSIALKIQGVTHYGVIYNPITDQLFTAVKGEGAQLNGKRLRVSSRNKIEGSLISPAFPRLDRFKPEYQSSIFDLARQCGGLRYSGSATLDIAYVAAGFLDAIWRTDLQPWDMAAGLLMVTEAGGLVANLNGGLEISGGDFIAASPKMAKLLLPSISNYLIK